MNVRELILDDTVNFFLICKQCGKKEKHFSFTVTGTALQSNIREGDEIFMTHTCQQCNFKTKTQVAVVLWTCSSYSLQLSDLCTIQRS